MTPFLAHVEVGRTCKRFGMLKPSIKTPISTNEVLQAPKVGCSKFGGQKSFTKCFLWEKMQVKDPTESNLIMNFLAAVASRLHPSIGQRDE